jgi:manganese/zinc/iron transport system permease protein
MEGGLFSYFTDPVLRAPMIGSILLCFSSSLVGVLLFLRKESLMGEALSHAAYPGLIVGVAICGIYLGDEADLPYVNAFLMVGAFFSAMLGLQLIRYLTQAIRVKQDAALCFVLSFFFGVGILLASRLQFSYSTLYKQVQVYLYGQSATMTDFHILIFGLLAVMISFAIYLFRKDLELFLFDPEFATAVGMRTKAIEWMILVLVGVSIVAGMRAVGVIMMAAMLIAPAAAARQCTDSFGKMCLFSVLFGTVSALFGTYYSNEISLWLKSVYPEARLTLPTGPLIVIISAVICLAALLFAPKRGALMRLIRLYQFRRACLKENILKAFWRQGEDREISLDEIVGLFNVSPFTLKRQLNRLCHEGWLFKIHPQGYQLTKDGAAKARKIVRLHRLWELYLADYVGVGKEKVHASAEEMEHIITPELERELDALLQKPRFDPHAQPIPEAEH